MKKKSENPTTTTSRIEHISVLKLKQTFTHSINETKFSHVISQFPVSGFYPLISHPHSCSPPGFAHCPCKYPLCKKLQPTCCCSCSYYTLMLLYVYMIIYSLTWPDPILHRGAIACSISAYTASDNTSM